MLPKRVGLPRMSPSARCRSASVAYGGPESGTACGADSLLALTGGTVRSVAGGAGHGFDAAAHLARQLRRAAVARVIDDEDFAHCACECSL